MHCSALCRSAKRAAKRWSSSSKSSDGSRNTVSSPSSTASTATRAELLKLYGGRDDDAFLEYLNENCYDLHYGAALHAQPVSFGVGNLWRVAVHYPESPVPPCIHRAPENIPGGLPRLLLIH